MNFIEPRTLAFVISVLTALSALTLLAMRQSFSATVRGVNSWTIGIWTFLICSLLFNFRGQLHPLFSVVLANLLLIISLLLMISGLLHYHGRRLRHHGLVGVATLAFTAVIVWFTLIQPNFQFRLVFVAGLLAFILAGLGYLALQGRPVTTGRVVTGAAFLFGAFSVTFFIGTLGFILMINERLREILQYNAEHDELSAALTRRAFFEKTKAELSNGRKSDNQCPSLFLILITSKKSTTPTAIISVIKSLWIFAIRYALCCALTMYWGDTAAKSLSFCCPKPIACLFAPTKRYTVQKAKAATASKLRKATDRD